MSFAFFWRRSAERLSDRWIAEHLQMASKTGIEQSCVASWPLKKDDHELNRPSYRKDKADVQV